MLTLPDVRQSPGDSTWHTLLYDLKNIYMSTFALCQVFLKTFESITIIIVQFYFCFFLFVFLNKNYFPDLLVRLV